MAKSRFQQGIALITVMLVLAIATVAVVSMSTVRQMDIRRTENQMRLTQAWEFVYSLEAWAGQQLQEEGRENKSDSLTDGWAKPLPAIQVSAGIMAAQITDLQGRINLNNIANNGKLNEKDFKRLQRLLVNLKLKVELADAILDWIDEDMDIHYPGGAEDETYTRLKPPYRSANRPLADISELLLVQGFTQEYYQKLLPYVYVSSSYEPLNVNTASATVLRCLADDINESQAESMFRASGKPFDKVGAFLEDEAVADALADSGIGKNDLTVTSNHFLLAGQIEMGKIRLQFESQLQRTSKGKISVIKRQRRSLAYDG